MWEVAFASHGLGLPASWTGLRGEGCPPVRQATGQAGPAIFVLDTFCLLVERKTNMNPPFVFFGRGVDTPRDLFALSDSNSLLNLE